MSAHCKYLKAIVFDWAGTTIDFGSRAPALVFQRVFREQGIEVTIDQAREPMGMAKREHIAAVAAMPAVAQAWSAKFGRACDDSDIDRMYAEFLPLQKHVLVDYSELIPGAADAVRACREMGLAIGSSTGYTRELMEVVSPEAKKQGYVPDIVLCSEDAPRGRPAPFLIYEAAKRLNVFPTWHMVKVDDTTVGIEAGRNAGCWTIGVTRSGNLVGRSEAELNTLDAAEQQALCDAAAAKLNAAGAHFTVESVIEVPALVQEIDHLIAAGKLPIAPVADR